MIYLDGRPDVTFSLHLKAVADTSGNALPALRELCGAGGSPSSNLKYNTIDELILALKSTGTVAAPLSPAEAWAAVSGEKEPARALLELAGVKFLDPFDFSAYISLAVLLRRRKNAWRLPIPDIGDGSPDKTFELLQNSTVTIATVKKATAEIQADTEGVKF